MGPDLATERSPRAENERARARRGPKRLPRLRPRRSAVLSHGALLLTGNREAAGDPVQETPERACREWRSTAAKNAPDAYVRRITVNLANDRWRRLCRTVPTQDGTPGDDYGQVYARDQLVRAFQRLPIRRRTGVVLRYFHDLSDDGITAALRHGTIRLPERCARQLRDVPSKATEE
ncbi:sigma factor [Streptomyces sp. NBC_01497]|uniref:sigma factor n=1 Tax=Streptomyces sp. NBC_01497 TaxID=2903885 RepID=UPI002E3492D5|nr:sigma factor [Streptomyces sp. NBC_01497]